MIVTAFNLMRRRDRCVRNAGIPSNLSLLESYLTMKLFVNNAQMTLLVFPGLTMREIPKVPPWLADGIVKLSCVEFLLIMITFAVLGNSYLATEFLVLAAFL